MPIPAPKNPPPVGSSTCGPPGKDYLDVEMQHHERTTTEPLLKASTPRPMDPRRGNDIGGVVVLAMIVGVVLLVVGLFS